VLHLFSSLNCDRGLTLMVVTHSPEVARRCGRVLWLRDGRLVKGERNPHAEGPPGAWASSRMSSPLA
jgi:ABC-type lipoprotein export system ATPase subunit